MKLEHQVCSLDLAKRLKNLGVKQESEFYHVERNDGIWIILHHDTDCNNPAFFSGYKKNVYSAFTVAELGELLPPRYLTIRHRNGNWIPYDHQHTKFLDRFGTTEADARANMLIYLVENGLVKP